MNIDAWAREAKERLKYAIDPNEYDRILAAAILSARNEALEDAAKVAENKQSEPLSRNEVWAMAFNDACVDVATAIRALKEPT